MASADLIGRARCPVCGDDGARLGLMKTQRVCLTCNACKSQVFARGDKSDDALRKMLVGQAAPAAAPAPEPAPAPVAPPVPAPAPAARGWGIFG